MRQRCEVKQTSSVDFRTEPRLNTSQCLNRAAYLLTEIAGDLRDDHYTCEKHLPAWIRLRPESTYVRIDAPSPSEVAETIESIRRSVK